MRFEAFRLPGRMWYIARSVDVPMTSRGISFRCGSWYFRVSRKLAPAADTEEA